MYSSSLPLTSAQYGGWVAP